MNSEIERKFIVKHLPANLNIIKKSQIRQGYIFFNADIEVRIRQKADKYFQTIKQGRGMVRTETEIELNDEQFKQLWPLTESLRIVKLRLEISYKSYTIELDIYEENLNGLKIAEVEFTNFKEAEKFIPPDWFDAEVTENEHYKNKYLALNGLK